MVSFGSCVLKRIRATTLFANGAWAGDGILDGAFTGGRIGGIRRSGDQAINAFKLDLCIGLRDRVRDWSGFGTKQLQ